MRTVSFKPLLILVVAAKLAPPAGAAAAPTRAAAGSAFALPGPPSDPEPAARRAAAAAGAGAAMAAAASLAWSAALFAAAPPPAQAAAEADVARGAALFKAECAGCHLGGQNFMSEKKTLKQDALLQFQSLDAAKLKGFVQSQMPHSFLPFHSKWSDQDFDDAIGYVLDQAVNDKWE
jgi:cytochrome c6